ncbi:RNA polymerase sigma factor [Tetragenococcus koreensis]|uniref:RNA polymerase sigma factor n=1 Tax=Tetragenococcus koreensis TaxID=290335 RepID=A0AAN4UB88_9ENTE|nr:sigma-70 family RNA polymerase sigma factor [Tetragenococcus koreensis]AYW45931.1 RNA polymerase sigma factor [Tetragenococcus koreensis]MCF1621374.1 sigma-70 family RNA polymerase sigma factor [Tetragenococcus koreensis]MCF1626376.1 sigma-70 family RNA polymerase sigma factor [Tetragenococcus koreensis]MCF1631057.1 sigma-70 family RNA polymerase sigma factor [Tetragenococcus koreensis]MCF1677424.1 sigma-70 family RNA polymerase sigma factor [Tetragenococcus koreensis]
MLTDKRLIHDILKKGANQAADELIRRYYDDLYFYLYRQVGNKNDALDLTQDAFIAALNGLSSYDVHKSSFRTWLFRIGTYKVIDARRKQKITWLELEDDEWVDEKDLDESLYQKELLTAVNHYVASFRPEIQEIFQLRVYGKLSFPEIASLLIQNEERIKAQYYRLIKKIREEFREYE